MKRALMFVLAAVVGWVLCGPPAHAEGTTFSRCPAGSLSQAYDVSAHYAVVPDGFGNPGYPRPLPPSSVEFVWIAYPAGSPPCEGDYVWFREAFSNGDGAAVPDQASAPPVGSWFYLMRRFTDSAVPTWPTGLEPEGLADPEQPVPSSSPSPSPSTALPSPDPSPSTTAPSTPPPSPSTTPAPAEPPAPPAEGEMRLISAREAVGGLVTVCLAFFGLYGGLVVVLGLYREIAR